MIEPPRSDGTCRDYAAERVALWIARVVGAEDDPRTLKMWARSAGVSVRVLQYGCFSASVSPAACRDLARVLRLIVQAVFGAWDPFAHLNADPRTVRRLMALSALTVDAPPESIGAFLSRQLLVKCPRVMRALKAHFSCEEKSGQLSEESRRTSRDSSTTAVRNQHAGVGGSKLLVSPWKPDRE